jgi:hypothetical protein
VALKELFVKHWGTKAERSLASARSQARVFHDRNMRHKSGRWDGFFAGTNGMTLFTFYTANLGFSRVLEALETVADGLADGRRISVAGIEITRAGAYDLLGKPCSVLKVRDGGGRQAEVSVSREADWRTGELAARYRVSIENRFSVDLREDPKVKTRSGSTFTEDYAAYVAFFDIFRPLVAATAPSGNRWDNSDFQKACRFIVDADGGLPGAICLRDYGLMCAEIAALNMHWATSRIVKVHAAMIENGFVYGEEKLGHNRIDMFAMPASEDGRHSFLFHDRYREDLLRFTFGRSGSKVSAIELHQASKDNNFSETPEVSYSTARRTCVLADPTVVDDAFERALNHLSTAEEILCGRKIDYAAYAAFEVSDEFWEYGDRLGVTQGMSSGSCV